ncbi:MAG: heparinase II/III domain-containing protein [Anaerolineae bacterium]
MFFPPELGAAARRNAANYPWARAIYDQIVAAADPWASLPDEQLWQMVFGPRITRSWMVLSNGACPLCARPVPMYAWEIEPFARPWKARCPHCAQLFPTNDFGAYYRSGLDARGWFDPALADRSLLFNSAHPDAGDPLHLFGVDDGEGYERDGQRWRFIGAYLIYGQWKGLVVDGIRKLAAAYTLTGGSPYAHKAGVLLDRLADIYPEFDFINQGLVYEADGQQGYVSTWHDAAAEAQVLTLAYDQVRSAIRSDDSLAAFSTRQAERYQPPRPKTTPRDIAANIEERILRDMLSTPRKTTTNYPRGEILRILTAAVLDWPANRSELEAEIDAMVAQATAVDGVTGEKGLSAYASGVIQSLAEFLETWARVDERFLPGLLARHPGLRQTYRFHLDTLCLGRYYPQAGDCGSFDGAPQAYLGVRFADDLAARTLFDTWPPASMHSFLWRLYHLTGDPVYLQLSAQDNGGCAGLPQDIFCSDPERIQAECAKVVDQYGLEPKLESVNKTVWHLAVLRSGEGSQARAAWLKYDSGERHGHADCLNLGLMAYGLDLLPDFGYPPVQYGGWRNAHADWYRIAASHNTLVVDGSAGWEQHSAGRTTLWQPGGTAQVLRVEAGNVLGIARAERTLALVDLPDGGFYLVDILRASGGREHLKLSHATFGQITPEGLQLAPAELVLPEALLERWQMDPAPAPGWNLDWRIQPHGREEGNLHLRLTDLTTGAAGGYGQAWVSTSGTSGSGQAWIPCGASLRRSQGTPLVSTFVSVWEPYEGQRKIAGIRRLALTDVYGLALGDSEVALEISLADGRTDVWICRDAQSPFREALEPYYDLRLDGELLWERLEPNGWPEELLLANADEAEGPDWIVRPPDGTRSGTWTGVEGDLVAANS